MKILGIDIGGSGIKGGIVDTVSGQMLGERFRLETPENGKPKPMIDVINQVVKHFDWRGPIGCGYPGVIRNQTLMTAANLDKSWIGLDLANEVQETTGCPAWAINDADAAGLAEIHYGAGKGHKGVVILITVGTGLGTALFTDGILLPNSELGHLKIKGKDAEKRASGAARKRLNLDWKEWAERFDEYLGLMHSLLWPDLFIIGGGVTEKAEKFLPYINVPTEVAIAQMGNNAGIVGAAVAAKLHLKI
ncbi:MAG TPA: ROK family protein [Opitutales bacterium]|nr:ROK family protein [Opitutales bacterium]